MDTGIFALRLKEARTKAGLKQKELAEKVGVRPASISAYENFDSEKQKIPSFNVAVDLASELDVSLDWLCGIDKVNQQSFENPEAFFRMLVQIKEKDSIAAFDGFSTASLYNIELNKYIGYSSLIFRGTLIANFIEAYQSLYELHKKGDLNSELYNTCIEGLIKQYSENIDIADWVDNSSNNFSSSIDLVSSDEPPSYDPPF